MVMCAGWAAICVALAILGIMCLSKGQKAMMVGDYVAALFLGLALSAWADAIGASPLPEVPAGRSTILLGVRSIVISLATIWMWSKCNAAVGAFMKPLDQLYQVRGYTPVTPGSASGYTTIVN